MTDETVKKLKEIRDNKSRLCSVCGVRFASTSGKRSLGAKQRRTHEQQHYVVRMCGCLRHFASDDSIRDHRKSRREDRQGQRRKRVRRDEADYPDRCELGEGKRVVRLCVREYVLIVYVCMYCVFRCVCI